MPSTHTKSVINFFSRTFFNRKKNAIVPKSKSPVLDIGEIDVDVIPSSSRTSEEKKPNSTQKKKPSPKKLSPKIHDRINKIDKEIEEKKDKIIFFNEIIDVEKNKPRNPQRIERLERYEQLIKTIIQNIEKLKSEKEILENDLKEITGGRKRRVNKTKKIKSKQK